MDDPSTRLTGGDRADLRAYLSANAEQGSRSARSARNRLRMMVGPRQRAAAKAAGTRLLAARSTRQLHALGASGRPLLLNLGSGTYNAPGWVNIDLWGLQSVWDVHPDVIWDLRRPLPLSDGSVRGVFLEHVLEHLPAPVGLAAMDQAFRLLEPGGVIRVSVPDFGRYALSYAAAQLGSTADYGPDLVARERPGRPTDLMALSEVVYDHGHVSIWDATTLCLLLRTAGFGQVAESSYRDGRLEPVPDCPDRQGESLYVEGVRPS